MVGVPEIKRRATGRPACALAAAAATALALAAAPLARGAHPYTPPPGTPDLAKMVLQPSDFAKQKGGSSLPITGYAFYYPPGKGPGPNSTLAGTGERAAYLRDIDSVTTTAGVKLITAFTDVGLFGSTASAQSQLSAIRGRYGSAQGSRALLKLLGGSANKLEHAETLHSVAAGQQATLASLSVKTGPAYTIVADWVWLRVDGVLASVEIESEAPTLADSVAIALAQTVAAHITSVLGSK
jgi:hypothetical protein